MLTHLNNSSKRLRRPKRNKINDTDFQFLLSSMERQNQKNQPSNAFESFRHSKQLTKSINLSKNMNCTLPITNDNKKFFYEFEDIKNLKDSNISINNLDDENDGISHNQKKDKKPKSSSAISKMKIFNSNKNSTDFREYQQLMQELIYKTKKYVTVTDQLLKNIAKEEKTTKNVKKGAERVEKETKELVTLLSLYEKS